MALEMKFIPKKEGGHMAAKFKLKERTVVFVDPETKEERLPKAGKDGDKDNLFLLGVEGSEIDLERAQKLGLAKAPAAAKE